MREIDAQTQGYNSEGLRQFFAAAAKYLIKAKHWDDEHPQTPFDNNPVVQAFHTGFKQFNSAKMRGRSGFTKEEAEVIELLRKASGWKGRDLKWNTAKKRLTRLRKGVNKSLERLKSKPGETSGLKLPEARPWRGLVFYDGVIRRKYLSAKNLTKKRPHREGDPPKVKGQAV